MKTAAGHLNYSNILETARSRRSVRKFKEDSVSREDIEKIVTVGMQAPSGANLQPWDIVVVDDKILRDKISQYLLDAIGQTKTSKGFIKAPVFMILYGDNRVREFAPASRKDNDSWWEFTLNTSLANAFMCMQLAATSLGLGSQWVSAFKNPIVDQQTKELLGIQKHYKIFEMMAIGYPDIRIGKKKIRDISNVIHYNEQKNYRSLDELKEW